jgi:5'-methylthioadenosine phosphorylase
MSVSQHFPEFSDMNGPVEVAIIGGSGLYALAGLEKYEEINVDTPFGPPSDALIVGELERRQVAFLARHGRMHRLLPTEINYRANVFALKSIGVERILSASAVGSMRERIRPRDIVLVDQFIDRTHQRPVTFFGDGLAVHISFADPICPVVRAAIREAALRNGATLHDGGTYLCIEGPAFSTRAESKLYRSWGVDVIGMTNLQEAKLAREAEMCYATMALVTDYDCWHEDEEDVSVSSVVDNLKANSELAAATLRAAIRSLPDARESCGCGEALRFGLITPREAVPQKTIERLKPLIGKYFE